MWGMSGPHNRPGSRPMAAVLVIAAAMAALPLLPSAVASASAGATADHPTRSVAAPRRAIPARTLVTITDSGFDPANLSPVVGQVVQFDNLATKPVTVRATSGAFDSAAIPIGGSFSLVAPVGGSFPYASPELAKGGQLDVGQLDLAGNASDLAVTHLPHIESPPDPTFDVHPTLTIHASRTRAIVLLSPTATVKQANDAFAAAAVTIVGTQPEFKMVTVAVDDQGPGIFTDLDAAVDALRASPGIDAAALSTPGGTEALPQPPETAMVTRTAGPWSWRQEISNTGAYVGSGGNWGLEASRFPNAWNLNDAVFEKAAKVQTVVLDEGFADNKDLGAKPLVLCGTVPPTCNSNSGPSDHGTHTAGTVGAKWDNANPNTPSAGRSFGVSGGNPAANLELLPWQGQGIITLIGRAILAKDTDKLPDFRVLNFSATTNPLARDDGPKGPGTGPMSWGRVWAGRMCGPGLDDDAEHTVPCSPQVEDKMQHQVIDMGKELRTLAVSASSHQINLFVASGNDSDSICAAPIAQPPCNGAGFEVLDSRKIQPFAWADDHWTDPLVDNPIVIVEATDIDNSRAGFSNIGGDVSAPGVNILSTAPIATDASGYQLLSGTSMATPHVSALAGYLLAFDPDLTTGKVKQLIVGHATNDVTGGASPRIDAYASMLALPGAAKALVDVNDPSTDGNRRVVSGADGTSKLDTLSGRGRDGHPTYSEPDKHVDLRDFRRFRDAWLEGCQLAGGLGPSCPTADDVKLDGGDRHPKKDLNLDRCTYSPDVALGCSQTLETSFSRFDFNGDGTIGLSAANVPLDPSGNPVATGSGWDPNDLELLQKFFDTDTTKTEGWTADQLPQLLTSADVEVHADAFFQAGVSDVNITVEDKHTGTWSAGPARTLNEKDPYLVATQPVGSTGTDVRVRAEATVGSETIRSAPITLTMKPGEDHRVDLCVPTVKVKAEDHTLFTRADGVRVRLSLALCPTTDPAAPKPGQRKVTLAIRRTSAPVVNRSPRAHEEAMAGPLAPLSPDATLSSTEVTTDDNGDATVVLTPGTDPEDLAIDAESDLTPDGTTDPVIAVGSDDLGIADPPRMIYRYEQTTTDWNYESSFTRSQSGGLPDDQVTVTESASDLPYTIERAGALTPAAGGGARLTETVSGDDLISDVKVDSSVEGVSNETMRSFIYPKQKTKTGVDASYPNVLLDSVLPNGLPRTDFLWYGGVKTDVSEDRNLASFSGIEDLDGITYPYATQPAADPIDPNGSCTSSSCQDAEKDQLQFIEREIRSGMRMSDLVGDGIDRPGGLTRILNFTRNETTGAWSDPYTYCEPIRTYPLRGIDAGTVLGEGSGTATSSFRFVAAIADATHQTPADLALPDCSAAADPPPVADFTPTDATPEEGRVVGFTDLSSGDVSTWAWDFGDGDTSTEPSPTHTYEDNGSYDVKLTVTDAGGQTDHITIPIDVANAVPEVSADDVTVAQEGDPVELNVRLTDPGVRDAQALQLEASWDTSDPALPAPVTTTLAAGATQRFDLGTLPFGSYQLTLKVTDKDGGVASATVSIAVGQAPVDIADDPVDTDPGPNCDFGIALGGQENASIDLLNTYREASGLPPLAASGSLTLAAEAHAQWMVDNGLLSHIGADGSTPQDRAIAAGYDRENAVGENLAFTGPLALDAIFGWRNSPTHNANMLRPAWAAVGVARIQTLTGTYWVHVFGDTVDCPDSPPAAPAHTPTATKAGAEPAVSRFHAWGPGGEEGPPLDSPTETGVPIFRPGETPFVPPDNPPISFPPPAPGTPPKDVTFTGLVVSSSAPATNAPITLTNRSTRNGALVAGSLDVDDGRPTATAPPGGSTTFTVVTPGPLLVTLTGTSGLQLQRTLAVGGVPVTAVVSYLGDTGGVERSNALVKAKVIAGGSGVAGRTVTFDIGGATATATTGLDGIAESKIRLTMAPGPYTQKVDVAATAKDPAVSTTAGFLVGAHTPPVADAGGPYTSLLLDGLALDASASQSSSAGGLLGAWDLDGDGQFDDAGGLTPTVAWADVNALVCGGSCTKGTAYPIGVQVTDALGSTATATTTVTLTSTYAISVDPPAATLNPGGSASFTVTLSSMSLWDKPVHLSIPTLPAGVTASFATNDVVPNAAVTLTLSAAADVSAANIDFVIHADSAGVVRETGRSINLEFGLVPSCKGVITGSVLDAVTGAPVNHAWVSQSTFTAADGTFTLNQIDLGTGNRPVLFTVYTQQVPGYFDSDYSVTRTVGCGNPLTATLRITPQQSSSLSGTVVEGIPDPFDRSPTRTITPSTTPIPDAQVSASSSAPNGSGVVYTAADGGYRLDPLRMGAGNLPTNYNLSTAKSGYWRSDSSVTLSPGSPAVRQLVLVKVCTSIVDVRVLDDVTNKPLAGASISVANFNGTTDQDGRARFDKIPLGVNNSSLSTFLSVRKVLNGRSVAINKTFTITSCGSTTLVDARLRGPIERLGSVTGRVVDEETGAPLANMTVALSGVPIEGPVKTDANGVYRFDNVLVGFDDVLTVTGGVSASDSRQGVVDRYEASSAKVVTLRSGETVSAADLTMLRIRRGSIRGTVVDAVTGQPIAGAQVLGEGSDQIVGADGAFTIDPVALGPRNSPRQAFIGATRRDYWSTNDFPIVTADGPTTTQIKLLRACAPASVQGRVINAVTKDPIPDAYVKFGPSSTDVVRTDALGHYEVPSIAVPQNRPFETTLLAYADGFDSQSRTATIQCGARLTVDFAGSRASTASVTGTVTAKSTGNPIAGASVVGEWGGSAVTAADGTYTLTSVPLADDGTGRSWNVSVQAPVPSPLLGLTKSVVIVPAAQTTADFALAGPTNEAPVAASKAITVTPGQRGSVALDALDPDGGTLRFFPVGKVPSWITYSSDFTQIFYVAPADGTREGKAQFLATDGQADSNVGTVTITISSTDPVALIATPSPYDEGSSVGLDGSGSVPGTGATITAYAWDLDHDGAYDDATGATTSRTFPNDGQFTVGLRVTDSTGATATTEALVTIRNVTPVVSAGADVTIGSDGAFTRTVTFTDPGADSWTGTVDWDGAGSGAPEPVTITSRSFAISHTFTAPGTYPVLVSVCDGPGSCGTDTASVVVPSGPSNRLPTAVIAPVPSAPEGSTVSLDGTGSSDPDGSIASYAWDLDDDGAYDDATGGLTSQDFPQDGTYTVGLQVTDDVGGKATTTAKVTITNVTPTVELGADAAIDQGQELTGTALLTDPGTADVLTATIDFGEGPGAQPEAVTVDGHTFDWAHTFTTAGLHTVTATVCDDADACSTDTISVNVAAPPPPDPVADLAVAKTHVGALVVGAPVEYLLAVTNDGPDTTAGLVTVTDVLPAGLSDATATGAGWTCSVSTGATPTVTCGRTGGIGAGPAPGITVTATVSAAAGATVANTATVSSLHDPNPDNDSATDSAVVEAPPTPQADLAVKVSGPTGGTVGIPLAWKVDVTNAGPDASGPLTVDLELPANSSGGSAGGPGWTCTGLTCTHGALGGPAAASPTRAAATSAASITVTATVGVPGTATFQATVSGTADDPKDADNTASLNTVIQAVTTTTTSTTTSTTAPPTTTSTTTSTSSSSTTTTAAPGSSTSTSLAGTTPTTPGSGVSGTDAQGGQLARTGTSTTDAVPYALVTILAGFVLVLVARRRRRLAD